MVSNSRLFFREGGNTELTAYWPVLLAVVILTIGSNVVNGELTVNWVTNPNLAEVDE